MSNKVKKSSDYISIRESRAIMKHNIAQMKYYESLKNRKLELKDYTSLMKNENNML